MSRHFAGAEITGSLDDFTVAQIKQIERTLDVELIREIHAGRGEARGAPAEDVSDEALAMLLNLADAERELESPAPDADTDCTDGAFCELVAAGLVEIVGGRAVVRQEVSTSLAPYSPAELAPARMTNFSGQLRQQMTANLR